MQQMKIWHVCGVLGLAPAITTVCKVGKARGSKWKIKMYACGVLGLAPAMATVCKINKSIEDEGLK